MTVNETELTVEDIMRAALTPENFEAWKKWNDRQKKLNPEPDQKPK